MSEGVELVVAVLIEVDPAFFTLDLGDAPSAVPCFGVKAAEGVALAELVFEVGEDAELKYDVVRRSQRIAEQIGVAQPDGGVEALDRGVVGSKGGCRWVKVVASGVVLEPMVRIDPQWKGWFGVGVVPNVAATLIVVDAPWEARLLLAIHHADVKVADA